MGQCHCARCRKVCGAAFHTSVLVRQRYFVWTTGRELVERYVPESPFTIVRDFCRICGSYLGELNTEFGEFVVSAAILDSDPVRRPVGHEWVRSAVAWCGVSDGQPCFDGYFPDTSVWPEPGRDRTSLDPSSRDGTTRCIL